MHFPELTAFSVGLATSTNQAAYATHFAAALHTVGRGAAVHNYLMHLDAGGFLADAPELNLLLTALDNL